MAVNRRAEDGPLNRRIETESMNWRAEAGTVNRRAGIETMNRRAVTGAVNRRVEIGTVNRWAANGAVNRRAESVCKQEAETGALNTGTKFETRWWRLGMQTEE